MRCYEILTAEDIRKWHWFKTEENQPTWFQPFRISPTDETASRGVEDSIRYHRNCAASQTISYLSDAIPPAQRTRLHRIKFIMRSVHSPNQAHFQNPNGGRRTRGSQIREIVTQAAAYWERCVGKPGSNGKGGFT